MYLFNVIHIRYYYYSLPRQMAINIITCFVVNMCNYCKSNIISRTVKNYNATWYQHSKKYFQEGSRFKLRWRAISRNATPLRPASDSSSCYQDIYLNSTSTGTQISNPGYPGYENNMDCTWILRSDPGTKIRLSITR